MGQPHIVVAESEYLIAMEAERLLRDLLPCEVTIVNPASAAACDGIPWEEVKLALLDTGFRLDAVRAFAQRVRQRGIPVVFTTANAAYMRGVPGYPGTPVLGKPFDAARFGEVIRPLVAAGITE